MLPDDNQVVKLIPRLSNLVKCREYKLISNTTIVNLTENTISVDIMCDNHKYPG